MYEFFYYLFTATISNSKTVILTGRKETKTAAQPPLFRGTIKLRNSGLAVGNGGYYVKTDHPNTHYRPLSEVIP